MSIRKKLYLGFGSILAVVFVMFGLSIWATGHEQGTKLVYNNAIDTVQAISRLDQARMNNRMHLLSFLLNGDSHESDATVSGSAEVERIIAEAEKTVSAMDDNGKSKDLLDKIRDAHRKWASEFAGPLMEKRHQVDAGSSTVAELQIAYLQAGPAKYVDAEEQPLAELIDRK